MANGRYRIYTPGYGSGRGGAHSRPKFHGADVGKAQRAWNALQRIYNLNRAPGHSGAYHKTGKHAGKRLYGKSTSSSS